MAKRIKCRRKKPRNAKDTSRGVIARTTGRNLPLSVNSTRGSRAIALVPSARDTFHKKAQPTKETNMNFEQRKQEIINQVNFAKAEKQDIETQKEQLEIVLQQTENKITSLLGALALCEEFIATEKKELAESSELAQKAIDMPETPEEIEAKQKI